MKSQNNDQKIIALCGKGGVGKTSISALIVNLLSQNKEKKILAIDADPASGLSFALNMTPKRTVDAIRNHLIDELKQGDEKDKREILSRLDFEIFDSLDENDNIAFLSIGRPETDGCYCQVNELLKDIIKELVLNFDYVVIDAEAGIEQVNRRVLEMVTHLVLLSDASMKGRNVVNTIHDVAKNIMGPHDSGVIFNRITSHEAGQINGAVVPQVLGWLPEDKTIRNYDIEGKSFISMKNSIAQSALKESLQSFLKL